MKRIVIHLTLLAFILLLSSCKNPELYENDSVSQLIKRLHEQSLITYNNDLSKLNNKDDLIILRNSIYARHGLIFRSKHISEYFSKCKWYKPLSRNVDSLLTDEDKSNIREIQNAEGILLVKTLVNAADINYRDSLNSNEKSMIGIWHESAVMPSGWDDTYSFYSNRKVIERPSTMDCANRTVYRIGNWRIKDNTLMITFTAKSHIVGGRYVESGGSCGSDKELVDGREVLSSIDESEMISITAIAYDTQYSKNSVLIKGKKYWKFDENPDGY